MPAATSPSPSPATEPIPEVGWSAFLEAFDWRQGEHLTTIGPTRSGKTTLVSELLRPGVRPSDFVCVLGTKRRDPLYDDFRARGYQRLRRWIVSEPEIMPRVLLAPKVRGFDSADHQREVLREAMDAMMRQGGWTVDLNEARYIANHLGLSREYEHMLHAGRTEGVTVITEAQRPRHIPLLAYDQATHLFLFRNPDQLSAKRLGEIGGAFDSRAIQRAVGVLPFHGMLYVNTETGELVRTKVEV